MNLYEQAMSAVHQAGHPKKAVWKMPPQLEPELLQAKDPAGQYVVIYHGQQYHLFGYPVEFAESAAGLALEVIEPGQARGKPGPSEVK